MAKQLDVYRDWLGIQESERPLNYYQLLRLKRFEDDTGKIRENYRKMNAHIRKFAGGDLAKQSQDLLNELAKAMLCLTDAQRKGEYDASLGRAVAATPGKRRTLEEILLGRNVIDQDKLQRARTYSNAVGVEIRDAIVQQKLAPADVVMPAYAESIGLPFLDLADIEMDALLASRVPAMIARQHSLAPVMIDNNQLLVASPNVIDPQVEDELRLRIGLPVRTVLCTPASIHDIVNRFYTKEAAAAEMAAGNTSKTAAKPKADNAAVAKIDKPLTAEEFADRANRRWQSALVGFNFAVMVVMMGLSLTIGFRWWEIPLAMLVGGSVAGITWVTQK